MPRQYWSCIRYCRDVIVTSRNTTFSVCCFLSVAQYAVFTYDDLHATCRTRYVSKNIIRYPSLNGAHIFYSLFIFFLFKNQLIVPTFSQHLLRSLVATTEGNNTRANRNSNPISYLFIYLTSFVRKYRSTCIRMDNRYKCIGAWEIRLKCYQNPISINLAHNYFKHERTTDLSYFITIRHFPYLSNYNTANNDDFCIICFRGAWLLMCGLEQLVLL